MEITKTDVERIVKTHFDVKKKGNLNRGLFIDMMKVLSTSITYEISEQKMYVWFELFKEFHDKDFVAGVKDFMKTSDDRRLSVKGLRTSIDAIRTKNTLENKGRDLNEEESERENYEKSKALWGMFVLCEEEFQVKIMDELILKIAKTPMVRMMSGYINNPFHMFILLITTKIKEDKIELVKADVPPNLKYKKYFKEELSKQMKVEVKDEN